MSSLHKLNKKTWSHLHHELYALLSHSRFQNKKFLLMVSGGGDSMAALKLWSEVFADPKGYAIFHYHHGTHQNQKHRDLAKKHVEAVSLKHKISCFVLINENHELKNEADFRKARYKAAQALMKTHGFDYLVTAHHQNDLLETRLIRLIRGTGADGLKAIRSVKPGLLRPWIQTSQSDLRQVLQKDHQQWGYVEDPTNAERKTLRNWVRNHWLLELNQALPGSLDRMAKSLELILRQLRLERLEPLFHRIYDVKTGRLDHLSYLEQEKETQKRLIARIYRELDQKNFTAFGVLEVMKQLDKTKEGHRFKVQGLTWHISDRYVMIRHDE